MYGLVRVMHNLLEYELLMFLKVSVEGMKEVPDTEKNRRRVERKLDEEVSVAVNLKGVAKFFKGEEPIIFTKKEVSDEEKTNIVTRSSKLTSSRIDKQGSKRRKPALSILVNLEESPEEEEECS